MGIAASFSLPGPAPDRLSDDQDAALDMALAWFCAAMALPRHRAFLRGMAALELAAVPVPLRVDLAGLILDTLPDAAALDLVDGFAGAAGWPLPPFERLADDARAWADLASPRERKFYAWAVVERLTPGERRALRAAIDAMERAA